MKTKFLLSVLLLFVVSTLCMSCATELEPVDDTQVKIELLQSIELENPLTLEEQTNRAKLLDGRLPEVNTLRWWRGDCKANGIEIEYAGWGFYRVESYGKLLGYWNWTVLAIAGWCNM